MTMTIPIPRSCSKRSKRSSVNASPANKLNIVQDFFKLDRSSFDSLQKLLDSLQKLLDHMLTLRIKLTKLGTTFDEDIIVAGLVQAKLLLMYRVLPVSTT